MDIDYKEQIKLLVKLQEHDSAIFSLEEEKEKKPLELEEWKERLAEKEHQLKDIEEKIKRKKLEIKEKELELKSGEDEVKKMQAQLYQIKTNKEYQALLHEIEGKKADNSLIEDQILEAMEELDNLEIELNRENENFKKLQAEYREEENRIRAEIEHLQKKIEQERQARHVLESQVKDSLLQPYERLLKNKKGLAIVPVRNNACQGCYLSLPPQVINEIQMYNKLVTCERCMRILYIDE